MINDKTIAFDEESKGWTSFFSYEPELMAGLNGKFFSFKDGELYQHNSRNVPRNNFYGVQYTSKVSVVFNENPSTEKMFKNIMLESNKAWSVKLDTNLGTGEIFKSEFEKKKSRFFAYTRRNEDESNLTSFSTNGIGISRSITLNTIAFTFVNDIISIGDKLNQMQSGVPVELGIVQAATPTSITVSAFANAPSVGDFCYATKNSRVEGGELRGYYMRANLESDETDFSELFAVTTSTVESYV